MKEAYYYETLDDNKVKCMLCPHYCQIPDQGFGRCQVRKNVAGVLYALNYGRVTGLALDPIEKKPLRHYHPGSHILSIGSYGCNFHCDFCQNWHLATANPFVEKREIDEMLDLVERTEDNIGLAYTYNEPIVFYEYMLDMAKAIKAKGYKNVMVTNGYINPEPLKELLSYVDAFNIDLKAFNDGFYEDICGGKRQAVMDVIELVAGQAHLEVTLLLIEGKNTDEKELEGLFQWLGNFNREIPLHISRYFPAHQRHDPPTPMESMLKAKTIAKKYLKYVYLGNVPEAFNKE
jgi:pyruvate formate lyase activating enzyme